MAIGTAIGVLFRMPSEQSAEKCEAACVPAHAAIAAGWGRLCLNETLPRAATSQSVSAQLRLP